MHSFVRKLAIAIVSVGLAGTAFADTPAKPEAKKEAPAKAAPKSLYDRLGGKDAITAVVKDFVGNVVADKRINKFFAKADGAKLTDHLVNQVCQATGGPCKYTGKDMKTAHKGMGIKEADFNALVEDLVKSLDKFKVPKAEKDELLGALGGMKGDIVEADAKMDVKTAPPATKK
ncbi:MAG: group 1 truncated hemoglobin [Deltaproteobacteria bacterium]|nr:group 1 truncated hemoglobin [Deltaproteobacteria bacterium]MCW5805641.1 group 1 truncated hemoglobin [Deltaproteobacteria bacterium]